jgi:outer membrane protein assembly factor BamB
MKRHTATLLATLAACGGVAGNTRLKVFSTDWEDDGGVSIGRVWQRVAQTTVARSSDVVIGMSEQGDAMVGLPLLAGAEKWTYTHPLDARPIVAGSLVVGSGGGEAFALDAATGRLVWKRRASGLRLVGAGDDGTITVVTFQRTGGIGSALLAVGRDGQVLWQTETEKQLGAPALLGRMAFVPWAGQYVSVIDLSNGDEAARVTLREHTVRAWAESGSLWFGGESFVRFDERIRDASQGRASVARLASRDLPGTPRLRPRGASPAPVAANAEDRVRLYARPTGGDSGASIEDARYYATYFRLAMGFDSGGAKLAWVHVHGADVLGGAAASGGLVLCDERGQVVELDARNGVVLSEATLGQPIRSCVVSADSMRLSGGGDATPLVQQLEEAVTVDDPELAAAQKVLLRELSAIADASVAKTLIELASDTRTSPDLLADARAAIAKRRSGAEYMEAALERHYDYLKDVLRAPPVGPMAEALGAMNAKSAAPLLAAHLLDPNDTEGDVKQAAAALALLAGPNEVPAMKQFFGMYRASAADDDIGAAVVSVGQALVTLQGALGRTLVDGAASDPMTVDYVREHLAEPASTAP